MSRPDGEAVGRAPWGTISREEIVAAAAKVVTAGGYEEMSIRSLAASLGVAPMSLYRHIRDKDDLLGEVTDRLLAGRLGRHLAAYTTTGQFIQGLRYLLRGISRHAGTIGQGGT